MACALTDHALTVTQPAVWTVPYQEGLGAPSQETYLYDRLAEGNLDRPLKKCL